MAPIIFLAFARLYMPWQLVGQGGGLGNHFFFIGFDPFCFFGPRVAKRNQEMTPKKQVLRTPLYG